MGKILNQNQIIERKNVERIIQSFGYDIEIEAKKLENIYIELLNKYLKMEE